MPTYNDKIKLQENLTMPQLEVYSFLISHLEEFQRIPAMVVIASNFGYKSVNGAACHVEALYKKGYLDKVAIGDNKHHYVLTKFKVVLQEL